jgi:ketosteroid isomerase-like protein
MAQSNVDILRSSYERFNRQDLQAVLELFDENIEWQEPDWLLGSQAGTLHGRDAVLREVFRTVPDYWDRFELEPRELYDAGDTVVAEGRFRVVPKGGTEWIDIPFAHVWRFRNGKAVSMHNYIDVKQLRELQTQLKAA